MKILITKTGKRHHYYENGDVIQQLSTKREFQIVEVDIDKKEIITYLGTRIPLSPDVKPTAITLKKATVVDNRVKNVAKEDIIYFAKLRPSAVIPTKEDENGDYDIYANFEQADIVILPNKIEMIPTGICSAFDKKYKVILDERGSSGSKGLALRCGVIDSGYRGEWFVAINNTTDKVIIITKRPEFFEGKLYDEKEITVYPYTKAICQAGLIEVPVVEVKEISAEELKAIPSKRGESKLGASGK